jgi:hypothetical protein
MQDGMCEAEPRTGDRHPAVAMSGISTQSDRVPGLSMQLQSSFNPSFSAFSSGQGELSLLP